MMNNPKIRRQLNAARLVDASGLRVSENEAEADQLLQMVYEILNASDQDEAIRCWSEIFSCGTPEQIANYSYTAMVDAYKAKAS